MHDMNLNAIPLSLVPNWSLEELAMQGFWKLCLVGCLLTSTSAFAQYSAGASGTGIFESTTTPGPARYEYGIEDARSSISHSITFTTDPVASITYQGSVVNKSNAIGLAVRGGGSMSYDFFVTSSPFTKVPIAFEGVFSSSFAKSPGAYPAPGLAYLQTRLGIFSKNASDDNADFQTTFGYFSPYDPDVPRFAPSLVGDLTYSVNRSDPMKVFGSVKGLTMITTDSSGYGAGTVSMVAGGDIWMSEGQFLSGSAFIDPYLEIAPEFLAANPGSTLSITPGVGNQVASIPEPSTYALMLAGLGSLVICARRRTPGGSDPSPRGRDARP